MQLIEFVLVLDLLGEELFVFVEVIDFLVELVDVLVDEVVLLFVLEEARSYLLQVTGPTLFLYLLEALPNRTHCFLVILDNSNALLVLVDELPQSILHQWLAVSCIILLFNLAFPLEEVSTTAQP